MSTSAKSDIPALSAALLVRKGQAGPSRLHAPVHRPPRPISAVAGPGPRSSSASDENQQNPPGPPPGGGDKAAPVKLTVRVDPALARGLRLLSAREGVSQQALVQETLRQMIS